MVGRRAVHVDIASFIPAVLGAVLLLWAGAPFCDALEVGSGKYVPEQSRAGAEAAGKKMASSSLKLYIPESLKPGEKLRGYYRYIFNQSGDSPVLREFAERAKFAIGPRIEPQGLRDIGDDWGHPELETIPTTYYGHSAGGIAPWWEATDPSRITGALALIAHHSLVFEAAIPMGVGWWGEVPGQTFKFKPHVEKEMARGELPVWSIVGARDQHQILTPLNLQAAAAVSGLGWKWTFVQGHGEAHGSNHMEALKLQTLWLEDVADLRGAGEGPLTPIDETECWVGYIELFQDEWFDDFLTHHPAFRVAKVEAYPYAEAPGKGVVKFEEQGRYGGYVWLPSKRFAHAWVNYHRTASVDGDATPRILTDWWLSLTDTTQEGLGWVNHADFVTLLNLDKLGATEKDVRWELLEPRPEAIDLAANGRLTSKDLKQGVYRLRLRATVKDRTFEDDWYVGLRGAEDDDALEFAVHWGAGRATAGKPFPIEWNASLPLGLLQWNSSIDGELGTAFGDLGTSGTATLQDLTPGTHLITFLAYSAAPETCRQATSFLLEVQGNAR